MTRIPRLLRAELLQAAASFPCVVLTGPRRSGKTFLLREAFPEAQWSLLEDPDVLSKARADPRGFLDSLRLPAILDEIQEAPELLRYVRTRIDHAPEEMGRWLITGSQEFSLMRGVTESMAGRAAILRLMPFGCEEFQGVSPFLGGFPEVHRSPAAFGRWFSSYVESYVERDVRAVVNVSDIGLFRRFLAVLATRTGTVLNRTEIAAPLGISVKTVSTWLDALETTGMLLVLQPWYQNAGKRLLKSPRLYFADSGLACSLLGIESPAALERSPFLGAVFEGFVAAELAKHRVHHGRRPAVYWFRDQQGLEVDFVLDAGGGEPILVEAKATHTPMPGDARGIQRLRQALGGAPDDYVVHRVSPTADAASALVPGVAALSVDALLRRLGDRGW